MTTMVHNSSLTAALAERFWESDTGYWYPLEKGLPLARVSIGDDEYRVERRDSPATAWFILARARIAEFDPIVFSRWADSWDLVKHP